MIIKYNNYIKENLSTKNEIENWLDKMRINYYTIKDDLTVDVDNTIDLTCRGLTKIPVKFNKVNGGFSCYNNKLTTLEGCPNIIYGYFYCHENNLTTLEGCPNIIYGNFKCNNRNNTILKDINDLDSKILIENIHNILVSKEVFDKYFEYWITKDSNIIDVLKDKVSNNIKQKYSHLFQANNFDLI